MPIILNTWEAEIQSIIAQGQSGKKAPKIPSQPIAGSGGTHLSLQATWESVIRRIKVPGQTGQRSLKTILTENSLWWCVLIISAMAGRVE
jgi:hypothetical protein